MTSPGRLHLGPEKRVGSREAVEGQHRLLDAHVLEATGPEPAQAQVHVGQLLAEHQPAGDLGQGHADRLRHEGNRAGRPRVGLDHVELLVGRHRELDVHQADHAEPEGEPRGRVVHLLEHLRPERHGRDHAGRVAGVHARLLDVLHDRTDLHVGAIAQRIHVDLDGVLQEAVEIDRRAVLGARYAAGSRRADPWSNRAPWRDRRARRRGGRAAGSRFLRMPRGPRTACRRFPRRARAGQGHRAAPRSGRGPRPDRWPPAGCPAAARRRPRGPAPASAGSARRTGR